MEDKDKEIFNLPGWLNADSIKKIAQILECIEIEEKGETTNITIKIKKS